MKKLRVMLCKIGLDGHERGVKVIAMGLVRAGMEVIYTGMYQTSEGVVTSAIQEDVDVIGISTLSGGHMATFGNVMGLLKQKNKDRDILVIAGGIIPQDDVPKLKELGVSEVFRQGTKIDDVVRFIENKVTAKEQI